MRRDAPASHSMRDYAWGYTLVGGLAAGVDIGGFHWLAPRLEPLLLAAVSSFVLAAMVNYTLSSLWVYRRPWRSLRRAALFLAFACLGLAVNAGVTWWLASAWPVHATLAKVGGVATAFGINFWMNTRLVFARVGAPQASP
jgi:putative flippase GtrA